MDEASVLRSVEDAVLNHGDHNVLCQGMHAEPSAHMVAIPRGRAVVFTPEQKTVLLRYFEEYGMTSTHRRNTELMQRCAVEVGTTVERIKNWIGSEAVKRKRKAGILPRPKIEITGSETNPKIITGPPMKKIKRVNGYNLFFSNCVRTSPEISTEFRERNAVVAQKWAALSEDSRKEWAMKAEAVCSAAIQDMNPPQPAPLGMETQRPLNHLLSPELSPEGTLVEKTLLAIQEKFDLLEQLGFEGYAVLVNTGELQTHLLATSKGKGFHKMRQQVGKPLENPFIGFVFSYESDGTLHTFPEPAMSSDSSLVLTPGTATSSGIQKRPMGLMPGLNSMDTMQKSVMNAFSLKYKVATGRSEVPYDNLQALGVQVYGMPPGIAFHSPLLYNQQQLQQILANLEKIVFLKVGSPILHDHASLTEVEIGPESVASLVTTGHDLPIGAEEEANQ